MYCKICGNITTRKNSFICSDCREKKYEIVCPICKTIRLSSVYYYLETQGFCSCKSCAVSGENNPGFGKKWSEEKKKRQSEIIKSKVNEEYLQKCSLGMKGKTVSKETKDKKRNTEKIKKENGYIRPSVSEQTRKKIGAGSLKKFLDISFISRWRKTMEERGIWTPKKNKDDYLFYRDISNWNCDILSFDIDNKEKLNDIGIFNIKNNRNGLVRDHKLSRKSGFLLSIFPELIRHPANCELITHSKNISKREKNSLSVDELFERIIAFKESYKEQEKCLSLIERFKNGEKYDKLHYL